MAERIGFSEEVFKLALQNEQMTNESFSDVEFEEKEKDKAFQNSGVGKKYLKKSLSDFKAETDEQKKQLEMVKKYIADVQQYKSKTLWLCGNAGTGKTFLASMIARECKGHYVKSYDIEDEIEISRSFSAKENKKQVLSKYYNYRLLVIDEVGKFENKQYQELEYLFRILNERYERELSTVIVTNKSGTELREYLGIPLYDRFISNCTLIEFKGASYRIKERDDE